MDIPKKFRLFATTYNIKWNDEKLNDKQVYGLSDYGKAEIILCKKIRGEALSKERIIDTFYHERTHAILDAMDERELSENEKFVDVFSKLLRQADESAEFEVSK